MKVKIYFLILIFVMSLGCLFLVNSNLSKTNASLNNQLQQQEQTYSGKIDELTVYQEKLVERISLLEENYQKLQTAYDELKAAYDQYVQDSTIERETIQNTVVDLRETIAVLENNADVDAETITALEAEVVTLEQSLENQTTTVNELQATVTQQEATIAELNVRIDELIADLNSDLTKIEFYQDLMEGEFTEVVASDLEGVTKIRPYAFFYCQNLISIELPNSLITIDEYAFSNCSSLSSIIIPNSVITISSSAFRGCTNLISVELSNSLPTIGSDVFNSCSSLTSIIIPNSVTSISSRIFYNCDSLLSIYIHDLTVINFSSIKSNIYSIVYGSELVTIYTGSTELPSTACTFWNCIQMSGLYAPVHYGYTLEQYLEAISA